MSTIATTERAAKDFSQSGATVYNERQTLDSLADMSSAELENLYRSSGLPEDLSKIAGRPKGRMLTVHHTDGTLAFAPLRELASMNLFPWDGKSFSHKGAGKGTGINRVKLLFAQFDWFSFQTRVEPSAIDGKPCIFLDYDEPGNPFFIARIHDEIRCVSPGLYMGPAMWKRNGEGPLLILWFAVDFNQQR